MRLRFNPEDFVARRRAQLAIEEKEETLEAMREAARRGVAPVEDSESGLPSRQLATAYHEATMSWMHKFSDIRSDANGFFILHDDNPDAWRMQEGDLIQDVAVGPQPYWQVAANDHFETKRVDLKPIGSNPFLTGVGAGGAKITKADIKVMTGEYEDDRVNAIHELLQSGNAEQISQVAYILAGTVGLNFGPNGPQGGWYNAGDTWSNRGGRQYMTAEAIVKNDAKMLRRMGFSIPDPAIAGEITDCEWSQFIGNAPGMFNDWTEVAPTDPELLYHTIMSHLEEEGRLNEWQMEHNALSLQAWPFAIKIVQEEGVFSFDELKLEHYEHLIESIVKTEGVSIDLARKVISRLKDITKWVMFSTPEEELGSFESAILNLDHKQGEVQMRSAARCIMTVMSGTDEAKRDCYNALRDFIRSGHGYWLVNEMIINWAGEYLRDAGLLIDATRLPDGTNRRYAYWGLSSMQDPYLVKAAFTEDNPEALVAIASAMKREYLPGRHVTYYLINKLTRMMGEDESIFTRVYASDALSSVISLARRHGFYEEADEASRALTAYRQQRNPRDPSELEDDQWLDLVEEHMHSVVASA